MDIMIKEEDILKKGMKQDDFFQMTDEGKKQWKEQFVARTKAYLFSIGQPLVYEKDGKMIAEYEDGKVVYL